MSYFYMVLKMYYHTFYELKKLIDTTVIFKTKGFRLLLSWDE